MLGGALGAGAEEAVDLGLEVDVVVFEVPGGADDDVAEGDAAALGVQGGAGPLLWGEGHEQFGGPAAEGVDGGDVAGDGLAEIGGVEGAVGEGHLVPDGEDGVVLGEQAADAEGHDEFGVGEVAQEEADGPAADAGVGEEGGVEVPVVEVEEAWVEVLDAAAVAEDERGGVEGVDVAADLGMTGDRADGGG